MLKGYITPKAIQYQMSSITEKVYTTTGTKLDVVTGNRESTSLKVDPELWSEVKIMAIKKKMNVSDYFDQALREKLERDKNHNDVKSKK